MSLKGKPDVTNETGYQRVKLSHVIPWLFFGMAPSFTLMDTLYLEMPWFEDTQSEGLNLAAWLGLGQAFATPFILVFFFFDASYRFSQGKVAIYVSILSLLSTIVVAFLWHVEVGNVSVFLFLTYIIATCVGMLRYTVIVPWMCKEFESAMISTFSAGSNLSLILAVGLSAIQDPGSARRFSPDIFFIIVSVIFFVSTIVGCYVITKGVARLEPEDEYMELPLCKPGASGEWRLSLAATLFPPWWKSAFRYVLYYMTAAAFTWWIGASLIPYAAANATADDDDDGEETLQQILWMQDGTSLLGATISIFAIPGCFYLKTAIFLNAICITVIALAAIGLGNWTLPAAKVFLFAACAFNRLLYGWIVPLIFREISARFPTICEGMSRHVALWCQLLSIPYVIAAYLMIISGVLDS